MMFRVGSGFIQHTWSCLLQLLHSILNTACSLQLLARHGIKKRKSACNRKVGQGAWATKLGRCLGLALACYHPHIENEGRNAPKSKELRKAAPRRFRWWNFAFLPPPPSVKNSVDFWWQIFLHVFPSKNRLNSVTPKTSENFTTFSTARKEIYHLELALGATSRNKEFLARAKSKEFEKSKERKIREVRVFKELRSPGGLPILTETIANENLGICFRFRFRNGKANTMLGANLSDQIPEGPNLTLTLTLNSN